MEKKKKNQLHNKEKQNKRKTFSVHLLREGSPRSNQKVNFLRKCGTLRMSYLFKKELNFIVYLY